MSKVIRFSDFDEVYEYRIAQKRSGHSTLFLKTRIEEEKFKKVDGIIGRVIKADVFEEECNEEELKHEKNIFLGTIDSVQIDFRDNGYCEIGAKSFSKVLDLEPKKRIFQNQKKTLLDIIRTVCSYDGIVLKGDSAEEKSVPSPVIQYNETDWQFLLRICKQYGYSITINHDFDNENEGTVWIGNIERKPIEISFEQVISKSYEEDAVYIKFQDKNIYEVGDSITLNNKKYYICSCDFYMENWMFIREYVMTDYSEEFETVMNLEGLVISAEVVTLEGEGKEKGQIQVKFDWEKSLSENPIWIDWLTSYCDESVGIYNMPAIGEKVLITLLDSNGLCMVAHNCLRKSDIDNELKVTDKIVRIGEKEILINEDAILINNKNSKITIESEKVTIETPNGNWKLTNEKGTIETDGDNIRIEGSNIEIKSGKEVIISGEKTTIESSSIVLKGMVEVK